MIRTPSAGAASKMFAIASLGSGALLVLAPQRMGKLYGLPRSRSLLRLLGARDVLIGALQSRPKARRFGALARACSDLGDAVLIAEEARRRGRLADGRIVGALLSAAAAFALASASS
jgi:hypothetical protein